MWEVYQEDRDGAAFFVRQLLIGGLATTWLLLLSKAQVALRHRRESVIRHRIVRSLSLSLSLSFDAAVWLKESDDRH